MDNIETAKNELVQNLMNKYNMNVPDANNLSNTALVNMGNLSMMNMAMLAAAIYYQQQNRRNGGDGPPLRENIVKQIITKDAKLASMNYTSLRISLIRHLRYLDMSSRENEELIM